MVGMIESEIERLKKRPVVLKQVVEYYHQTLLQNSKALDYLNKRGLNNLEAIRHFKLGFANRTLSHRLSEQLDTEEAAMLNKQLQDIGVLSPKGQERFSGTFVVPILAPDGEVLQLYGRKTGNPLKTSSRGHRYLPGSRHGVWNETALAQNKEAILCKGLIDALTFWCAGYRNVTAIYGVEGFTAEHLDAFKRYDIERVIIAYGCTPVENRAALTLAWRLRNEGIDCYQMDFATGTDPNRYACSVSIAEPVESLGTGIRVAQWLGAGERKPLLTAPRPPYGIWPALAAQIAAQEAAAARRSHS